MKSVFLSAALLLASAVAHAAEPIRIGMIEGMSGAFANAGQAVVRNLRFAIDRINAGGGVALPGGARPLELVIWDNKQGVEESLVGLRHFADQRIPFIVQGNSSAVAAALIDAVDKHNQRSPQSRMLFLNYSAVDPALTNEKCSYWHFRFDAHADMRMHALTEVIRGDSGASKVYLIGQDYSFGQQLARSARAQLAAKRPDIAIVGDELHPIGKIKDFSPYIAKIKASGADTVITGNWGNDLTLLVKAAREQGLNLKFYTFYGNGLGAPASIGDAGVGRVRAVAEWHPNTGAGRRDGASDDFYLDFRRRYPKPEEDYVHLRMQLMIAMLADAVRKAGGTEAAAVARALEGARYRNAFHEATMRAEDHQLIQPLYVSVMQKAGDAGLRFDNEGSGYGFKTERYLAPAQTALPGTCRMRR
ncbi:branched-chain amino acid ABC transporter substrate-binding protein [Noviherbaspirillum aridicola]|uniref:Branched-chain amino acid ABC transporter substrate-binding protein n=1 Tax=Noviherbaspirillum aridicola TaxID=2849687 RepID=A0ABQ4Q4B5_9BURK|nr:branched-chain amino acid ABC transporter substrate-binding protein [Noviherbaspirillum aridicola]GIZ51640.1 branched-chain amino acid ABC transporter substrate-binding protein [Noviherbaspirillum aridicola]